MLIQTLGIFVGGSSRRMGRPKGRLRYEGQRLIERAVDLSREAGLTPCIVGDAEPYVDLVPGVERVTDAPRGLGPIGGVRAMLLRGPFISLACDMPFVGLEELRALCSSAADSPILAPRGRYWEPLFARYRPAALAHVETMLETGEHRLQSLCDRCAEAFDIDPACLKDWDTPADLPDA